MIYNSQGADMPFKIFRGCLWQPYILFSFHDFVVCLHVTEIYIYNYTSIEARLRWGSLRRSAGNGARVMVLQ